MRKYNSRNEGGLDILLTLIYPLGGFLFSFRNLKSQSSYWVFFIFFILFGLCTTGDYEPEDSSRYVEEFYMFKANSSYNYSNTLHEFFSKDSEVKDVYAYTLYYITDFIGGNQRVLFGLAASIFAIFMLGSLKFLTKDNSFKNQAFFYLLTFIFLFSNSIYNINGFRFWTAAWIAVYATMQILIARKPIYLLLLLVTPMVHGSFYVYLFFFLVAYLIKKYYKILPYIFFVSFFLTDMALLMLPDLTDYLPPFLQSMVWNYTVSETAQERMSGIGKELIPLYAKVLNALPRYLSIILIFLLVRSRDYFIDEQSKTLLGFILAMGSLANMSMIIPSMGRFWYLIIPLYIYIWVHNSSAMLRYRKIIIYLVPIVYLYPLFLLLRKVSWTTDPLLFITNAPHIIIHSFIQ